MNDNGRIFSHTDRINVIVGRITGVVHNSIVQGERAVAFTPGDCTALDKGAIEMAVRIATYVANAYFSDSA